MLPDEHDRKRVRRSGRLSSLPTHETVNKSLRSHNINFGPIEASKATLKEVSIPTRIERASKASNLSNDDCSVSDTSFTHETKSSVYECSTKDLTPQTSVVPTPATSVKGKITNNSTSIKGNTLRKRKRISNLADSDQEQVFVDSQLARSLQAAEYGNSSKRAVKEGTGKYDEERSVVDSDTDSLSTAVSFESSDWDEHRSDFEMISKPKRGKQRHGRYERPSFPLRGRNRFETDAEKSLANAVESNELGLNDGTSDLSDESAFDSVEFTDDDLPVENVSNQSRSHARMRRNGRNGQNRESWMAATQRRRARERKKLEEAHPNIKTMWQELESIPIIPREQVAQPDAISRRLKPFQLEGLNWMIKQEQTHYRGGLLGDEMGMGKTIQAVSLIMSDFPAKNPTLVVVPPVALLQWSKEIEDYTNGKLKVLVFHGQKTKGYLPKDLKKYNVIMISYQSLESLYRKEVKGWKRGYDIVKEDSPIHEIHFHRVILDEAHSIKQRTTGIAKACFALSSAYKWCLSGTPVQNRIGEFFSLMRFLEVRPFADYFCKRCSCSQLHWSLNEEHRCSSCNHSGAEHVSVFNQELLNPIIQTESNALRQNALDKLRLITDRIMLRRMKRDYTSSMVMSLSHHFDK